MEPGAVINHIKFNIMSNVAFSDDAFKNSKLSVKLMDITPQIAREWLDSTDSSIQRRLSYSHVAYLAKEMKNGNWDLNGQPIQIDVHGNVVNGQHRLNACIDSGSSFKTLVVFDVETKAIKTIDEGSKPRGLSDFLDINYNCKNSAVVAAAMKFIFAWDLGWKKSAASGAPTNSSEKIKTTTKLSPAGAIDFLKKNPGFFDFINEASSIHQAGDNLITRSLFCSLLWIVERENPVHAKKYFSRISTGIGIEKNSPIAYVRKVLIEEQRHQFTQRVNGRLRRRATRSSIVGLIIKGFNYFAEGVEVPNLMQIPKDIPEIIKSKDI